MYLILIIEVAREQVELMLNLISNLIEIFGAFWLLFSPRDGVDPAPFHHLLNC